MFFFFQFFSYYRVVNNKSFISKRLTDKRILYIFLLFINSKKCFIWKHIFFCSCCCHSKEHRTTKTTKFLKNFMEKVKTINFFRKEWQYSIQETKETLIIYILSFLFFYLLIISNYKFEEKMFLLVFLNI